MGRKPIIPDQFFIENPGLGYSEAIPLLKEGYGVTRDIDEKYYNKRKEILIGSQSKRGRKPTIPDSCFLKNYDIHDPKAMIAAIENEYGKSCSPVYARNRMTILGIKIEKRSKLEEAVEEEWAKKTGRKPKVADSYFLENNGISDPGVMANTINEKYKVKCDPNYARTRMKALGIKVTRKQRSKAQKEPKEPKKTGRKPLIDDSYFLENNGITDPGAMAVLIHSKYNVDCESEYARKRMKALGMGVTRKQRQKAPVGPTPKEMVLAVLLEDPSLKGDQLSAMVEKGYGVKLSEYRVNWIRGRLGNNGYVTLPKEEKIAKQRGHKPKIADSYFNEHKDITDPQQMADTLNKLHGFECSRAYVKYRMKALGMEVARKRKQSLIPEEFFKENPNLHFEDALQILEEKYNLTEINKSLYYKHRNVLKSRLPEIKTLHRGTRAPLIPEEFFRKYPNVPYDEALKLLEDEFGIKDVKRGTFNSRRRDLKAVIPNILRISNKSQKPVIPEEFFKENPNMFFKDAEPIIKERYGLEITKTSYSKRRSMLSKTVPEIKRLCVKPIVPEEFFKENPNMHYEDAVQIIKERYGVNVTNDQYKYYRRALRDKIPEIAPLTRPKIPAEFFKENPNMVYEEAKSLLKERYELDVTKDSYYSRRAALKDDIPEIKPLSGKRTGPAIPKEFFEKHPNLLYHDAIQILKDELEIETSRDAYNRTRKDFRKEIPEMQSLQTMGSRKPTIPKEFFEKHPNLRHEDALVFLKSELEIEGINKKAYYKARRQYAGEIDGMEELKKGISRSYYPNPENDLEMKNVPYYFIDRTLGLPIEDVRVLAKSHYGIELTEFEVSALREKLKTQTISRPFSDRITTVTGRGRDESRMDAFKNKNWIPNLNDITRAIVHSVEGKKKMDYDDAKEAAAHVLNFFGFNVRIIDNVLEPEDRDLFYMLEDAKLLATENAEVTLYDGREWRIHYWVLDADKIVEAAAEQRTEETKVKDDDEVYKELPTQAWERNGNGLINS